MGRGWLGSIGAVVGAWMGAPWVFFMAGVGALLGGILGVVSGTAVGPGVTDRLSTLTEYVFPLPIPLEQLAWTPALQIGGIIGGLMGAASGAVNLGWIAFSYPWELLYAGDPAWPVLAFLGQLIVAVVVASGYTAFWIAIEDKETKIGGARRLSRREAEYLLPILHEVGTRMGFAVERLPTLRTADGPRAHAYCGARMICVSRALVEQSTHDQVAGVIAHELAHWKHGDSVATLWQRGLALPLYFVYNAMAKFLSGREYRPVLVFMFKAVAWSLATTVKLIVVPLQGPSMRRDEYRADAEALAAGYGPGLRSHLERHQDFEVGPTGWDEVMARAHPPIELRLERLEQPTAVRSYRLDAGAAPIATAPAAPVSSLEQE